MIYHMIEFNVADFLFFSREGLMSWVCRGTRGSNCKIHVFLFGNSLQLPLLLLLIPFASLAFCTSVQLPCNLDHKLHAHASIVTSTSMTMSYLPWDTLHQQHPQQCRLKENQATAQRMDNPLVNLTTLSKVCMATSNSLQSIQQILSHTCRWDYQHKKWLQGLWFSWLLSQHK